MKSIILRSLGVIIMMLSLSILFYVTFYCCIIKSIIDIYHIIATNYSMSMLLPILRIIVGSALSGSIAFGLWLIGLYFYESF